jgi:hypothetical protein
MVFREAALCASIAIGAFILLLLAGTQVLDWYWIALLTGGALAFGAYRTWRGIPSLYRLAQMLDSRLTLHDTLSTAYHFRDGKVRSEAVRIAQMESALAVLPALDLRVALPHPKPRSLYAASGLAMLACGVFAVRYGVTQSLDLRPSLVRLALDRFLPEETAISAVHKPVSLKKRIEDQLEKLGIKVNGNDGDLNRYEAPPDSETESVAGPSPDSKDTSHSQTASVDPNNPGEKGEASAQAEKGAADSDQAGNEQSNSDQQAGGKQASDQQAQKKGNQAGDQNPSLMDRMRDAMASLMNKLKTEAKGSQTEQASSKPSQDGRQTPGQGQKGSPMPGKPQGNSQSQGDQQGEQQGQGDRSQMSQGKSGEKSASSQPSQDAKSGIGKEDGDKSAREAEQLAAMGKISEIIGKRSQNLTGEIMVEVKSNKEQQLKTAYTGRQGQHAESGGEISRDEIPLVYQQYVQQYFEQIRKSSKAAAAKEKGANAGN